MAKLSLAKAIEKLAVAGEQAAFTVDLWLFGMLTRHSLSLWAVWTRSRRLRRYSGSQIQSCCRLSQVRQLARVPEWR
jgi:hypothetical protein